MKVITEYGLCNCLETTCSHTLHYSRLMHVYEDIDNYVTEYWVTKDIYNISHTTLINRDNFITANITGTSFTVQDVYFQYFSVQYNFEYEHDSPAKRGKLCLVFEISFISP